MTTLRIMPNQHPTTALVLGRFQPLHQGHLYLIAKALEECSFAVICIGSAQLADPFTIDERHVLLEKQLKLLYPKKNWRLVDLVDPNLMSTWPDYVLTICNLHGEKGFFYRSDKLKTKEEKALANLGFPVRYIGRKTFMHLFPDGLYRKVSSASEIKNIYKKIGFSFVSPSPSQVNS